MAQFQYVQPFPCVGYWEAMLTHVIPLGTVTRYELIGFVYDSDYEPDDPRKWRDKCEDVTMRLKDHLEMWKEKWMSLTWLCVPGETWPNLWFHSPNEGYTDKQGAQVGPLPHERRL